MGFRVTTNTTLFDGADPERVRQFFDEMMDLGVEGMMVSPGYAYAKAPDQEHFLRARETHRAALLDDPLEPQGSGGASTSRRSSSSSCMGERDYECTPWGMPDATTSSAGRSPATCCRTATPTRSRTDRRDRVGALRPREWQPEVPELHGPLRLRGERRGRHVRLAARSRGDGPRDALRRTCIGARDHAAAAAEPVATSHRRSSRRAVGSAPASPEALRVAFEYRGDVTLTLDDGASSRATSRTSGRMRCACGRRATPRCATSRRRASRRSHSPDVTPRRVRASRPGRPHARGGDPAAA